MSGFSMVDYDELIKAGRASGYRYLTFSEVADGVPDGERQCLPTHDLDVAGRPVRVTSQLLIHPMWWVSGKQGITRSGTRR